MTAMENRWTPIPINNLPGLGERWRQVTLRSILIPDHLRSSLIAALTRDFVCLARLPDGSHLLLLRVNLPVTWLQENNSTTRLTLHAERVRKDKCWFLALQPDPTGEHESTFPPGRLTITPGQGKGRWLGLRIGEHAEITPVELMRRWDWAWTPTIGPVSLRIYIDRTQEQLTQWVQNSAPQAYYRDEKGAFRSHETKDWWLIASEGLLYFAHGYHTVPVEQFAADQTLLSRLIQGELGELSFDVFDGDYCWLMATGHGCSSLRRYLSPSRFKGGEPHPWNQNLDLTIDAKQASADTYPEAVRAAILAFAGAPSDSLLDTVLRHTPMDRLPRRVLVLLPPGAQPPESALSPARVNNRIFWQWQMGPHSPDHPYVTVSE